MVNVYNLIANISGEYSLAQTVSILAGFHVQDDWEIHIKGGK